MPLPNGVPFNPYFYLTPPSEVPHIGLGPGSGIRYLKLMRATIHEEGGDHELFTLLRVHA
jgi:hypothetical protein